MNYEAKLCIISIHSKMLLLLYDKLCYINYSQKQFPQKKLNH